MRATCLSCSCSYVVSLEHSTIILWAWPVSICRLTMASETEFRWHPDIDKFASIGNSHYFALVNHTPWPITVTSGTAGDHVSGLEFDETVDPDECYIHDIMSSLNGWKLSAGGTFCITNNVRN